MLHWCRSNAHVAAPARIYGEPAGLALFSSSVSLLLVVFRAACTVLDRARERAHSDRARCASNRGWHTGTPLHPPRTADVNVGAVHIPGLRTQEVAYSSDRILDAADVPGGNTFGHAGKFSGRRAPRIDKPRRDCVHGDAMRCQ